MPKYMIINDVSRAPAFGDEDTLRFHGGVNVVVGLPNTGKSKWLRMVDYLLGADGRPEDIFGDDLAEKYESVTMNLSVGGQDWSLERKWRELGLRTKVSVNGELMDIKAASDLLMVQLDIPIVHYPQGSIYGSRTWPELGWRTLFRHIYRRQSFWSDLADNQPFSEQHACLMQFVGIARYLFSDEFSALIAKEKQIMELQTQKEQFVSMLQEVSSELIDEAELGVALTPHSIDLSIQRLEAEVSSLQEQRNEVLTSLIESKSDSVTHSAPDVLEELGERLASLQIARDRLMSDLKRSEEKTNDIKEYRQAILDEVSRLRRAIDAGMVLTDLKITNCPACDREVERKENDPNCYLCRRPLAEIVRDSNSSNQRLKFEMEQLEGELRESEQLLETLSKNTRKLSGELETASAQIQQIQRTLVPLRSSVALAMPPEVEVLDMEMGRLHERLNQLERIKRTLARRESISQEIRNIQEVAAALSIQVAEQAFKIDFEEASGALTDGMNDYLNLIDKIRPHSWTQDPVGVYLREKSFRFTVGNSDFKAKLGGTLTLYFLLAYHYALLKLTRLPDANYPGIVILDFPAELEDATTVADKENFVLEPFVQLAKTPKMDSLQVIAAGSAFENLEGAHRIELTHVW